MITRNGYIGSVPQQSSDGNKGVLSINSYSIEKRRSRIKTVDVPPDFSGKTLRFYLDASQVQSYSGSGSTWTDISGNGYHGALSGVSFTSSDPSYFTMSDSFNIDFANNIAASNLTFFLALQTTDTQSMIITSSNSNDYLGAYRSGNKYYSNNVGGNKTLYVNGSSASNLYDNIRGSTSRSVIVSDCDFGFTNQEFKFNTYDGYRFGNGKLYAIGAYTGNLTASDATTLHNFFDDRGFIGI